MQKYLKETKIMWENLVRIQEAQTKQGGTQRSGKVSGVLEKKIIIMNNNIIKFFLYIIEQNITIIYQTRIISTIYLDN